MNAQMDTESTELVDLRRDTLEAQVRERTAELEHAITDLKREVERRQQAESALKASEQRYQLLYEQNPFMYFTLTTDGIILSVNRVGADQLGYLKEDLIGQSIVKLFDSRDRQTILTQLKDCAASPSMLFQWEVEKIRKDGTRLKQNGLQPRCPNHRSSRPMWAIPGRLVKCLRRFRKFLKPIT